MNNQVSKRPAKGSTAKQAYLLAYNAVCAVLWSVLLGRAILLIPMLQQNDKLYALIRALWPLHPIAQGIALLEVVHALFGIVRASPVTTAMQVASRILVIFGILYPFPQVVVEQNAFGRDTAAPNGGPIAYAALIIAHGVTEVIRYTFFVWKEGIGENIPSILMWLRYNTFFVLYPLGISSECWLIYLALDAAKSFSVPSYNLFLKTVLAIYVPGSYILYTHMMSQRKSQMRKIGKGKAKQK